MNFRAFLAITLPETTQQEISALAVQLQKLNLPLTWEKPEKLHITLYFLGKIADQQLHDLTSSLQDLLATEEPLTVSPSHLDYFYKKHGDSIIFLRLDPDDPLKKLEKRLRPVLFAQDFSPPLRYEPHINIARLKRLRHPNQVKDILSMVTDQPVPQFSPFSVTSLEVYESNFDKHQNTTSFRKRASIFFGKNSPSE